MAEKTLPATESEGPSRTRRFDRGSFWPAIVIVVLVVAVLTIPGWLNHAVAESTRTVSQGETVTLEVDEENQVVVEPIPGWDLVDSPSDQLELRHRKANVTMTVAAPVDDLSRHYNRLTRKLRTTGGVQALPGNHTSTDTGFTGLTGTIVANGEMGELSLLTNGEIMLSVQSLVPAEHAEQRQPDITAMVNSVREQQ